MSQFGCASGYNFEKMAVISSIVQTKNTYELHILSQIPCKHQHFNVTNQKLAYFHSWRNKRCSENSSHAQSSSATLVVWIQLRHNYNGTDCDNKGAWDIGFIDVIALASFKAQ